jgi:hypothetical protein
MTDKHEPDIPAALEAVATRLGELEVVLGPQATNVLESIRAAVIAAMSARDRGDRAAAFEHVAQAMRRLASLADGLDPAEASLMRAAAARPKPNNALPSCSRSRGPFRRSVTRERG